MSAIKEIYLGTTKVRPSGYTLSYDFTTSNAGWDANGCSRDSRGFFRSGSWSDGQIIGPSEILNDIPKKITIVFNKVNSSSGTGIGVTGQEQRWGYYVPNQYNVQNQITYVRNGAETHNSLSATPSGIVTWEMDINTSTTPWKVTHKITGCNDVIDSTSGVFNYLWNGTGTGPVIRIVNWSNGTGSMCIRSATFEY